MIKRTIIQQFKSRYFNSFIMKRSRPATSSEEKEAKAIKRDALNATWRNCGELKNGLPPMMYMNGNEIAASAKIASFDMDGTLITTQSGRTFPTGPKDWKILSGKIIPKLKSLHEDGFKIVIFTNQAGLEKKKAKPEEIKGKIEAIMNKIGVEMQAFVATGENIYRKPYVEMWNFMKDKCNDDIDVDMQESFYCGDAAGRPKGWAPGYKKDFSCSDRKFAANIKLPFLTPEELFNGAKPYKNFEWGALDVDDFLNKTKNKTIDYSNVTKNETEMVLFVGTPASGKSTFAKRFFESKSYKVVNRDTLGTQEKCLKAAENSLKANKSVVIDNTNPSKDVRNTYITLAKKMKVPIRCFHFDIPIELAKHLNMFRQAQTNGKIRRIPDVGFNTFKSKFQKPETSEGFSELKKIEFIPSFDSNKDEDLFKQWT